MELGRLMLFGRFACLLACFDLACTLLLEMLAFTCLSGVGDSERAGHGMGSSSGKSMFPL